VLSRARLRLSPAQALVVASPQQLEAVWLLALVLAQEQVVSPVWARASLL
jgi:hypothetical protein